MRCLTPLDLFACLVVALPTLAAAQDQVVPRATPWTTSNVRGSPDPPLPYKTTRVFPNVVLQQPTEVVWLPDARRWIATQVDGRIFSFGDDPISAESRLFFDLNSLHTAPVFRCFAAAFHHDLANHPWCFVVYSTKQKDRRGTHLVRFKVLDASIPTIDPNSRVELASWNSSGHAGSAMRFGPDGYLYVSVGDGQTPYPPDVLNTGQDLGDIEASVLRIDVDHPTSQAPYRIPADNPFVRQPNARGEIWAYGFRNPWRMAFHPESGELYVGDIGWEMREMIHRVLPGRNHGWSIMEGSQPVKQTQQPAVPITPPLFEHTHVDSRSITGGYFWRSDRLPELKDAFIYGDWMTGKVWALKAEGDRVLWQKELVDTPLQIICFMQDPTGEVLIVGYDGTILRLETNDLTADTHPFPTRLSETGLFSDAAAQLPAAGVVEYEINAHHWADGTHSRQWIAIPGSAQLGMYEQAKWELGHVEGRFEFPVDTVLAKTVSYFSQVEHPESEKHIETQLLHRAGDEWRAYNYVWNAERTDALMQADVAVDKALTIEDPAAPGGQRVQTWHHSSRSECLLCHIWSAGTVHGFSPDQLNISRHAEKQLPRLSQQGLFHKPVPVLAPIVSPHDTMQPLEDRARSYLALNCSTCHRPTGGGTANFNFQLSQSLAENNYLDAQPAQGDFGIEDARIVAPGAPYKSIVLYRTLKSGRGHMPQFGSNVIDSSGVKLLHDWIASMPGSKISEASQADIQTLGPDVSASRIDAQLASTESALALSYACSAQTLDPELSHRIVSLGVARSEPQIRDLFEAYLPEEKRIKRLGTSVDEAALLALPGSAHRGQELFERALDFNCRQCHRAGSVGELVGPDLSGVGTEQTPAELLASLLRPSEKIDAKYRTRTLLTFDGKVLTGIVHSESETAMVIADAAGKLHSVSKAEIDIIQPSQTSIMPEHLLAGMTADQAADLLAFLASQRKIGPLQHRRAEIHRTKQPVLIDGQRNEAAWNAVQPVGDFVFPWWSPGDAEPQQTDARLLWDDENLYVSFYCFDKNVLATRTDRDSDVYRDDCVEVFASPEMEHPENYFNLEMNALGTQLDNYRPDGTNPQSAWDPDGIRIAVSVNGTLNDSSDADQGWLLEVAIPFRLFASVLPDGTPKLGDQWRLNLNRLEDDMSLKSQWSRGDRNVPRFHTPEFFGFVKFVE